MHMNIEPYQEERPWGNFRQFILNTPATVKILTVHEGEAFSLQSHTLRSEFWKVIQGQGTIEIAENTFQAKKGDEFFVPIGAKHRITAIGSDIEILEICLGTFEEGDISRYDDKYGRN